MVCGGLPRQAYQDNQMDGWHLVSQLRGNIRRQQFWLLLPYSMLRAVGKVRCSVNFLRSYGSVPMLQVHQHWRTIYTTLGDMLESFRLCRRIRRKLSQQRKRSCLKMRHRRGTNSGNAGPGTRLQEHGRRFQEQRQGLRASGGPMSRH